MWLSTWLRRLVHVSYYVENFFLWFCQILQKATLSSTKWKRKSRCNVPLSFPGCSEEIPSFNFPSFSEICPSEQVVSQRSRWLQRVLSPSLFSKNWENHSCLRAPSVRCSFEEGSQVPNGEIFLFNHFRPAPSYPASVWIANWCQFQNVSDKIFDSKVFLP